MAVEPTDLLLSDPTPDALADALDAAVASIVRGQEHWRALLDEVAEYADGRAQVESPLVAGTGSRYVSAAWWTDHRGVKHVRVCGGDTSLGDWHPHYSRLDDDLRPALWHVFMDRVFRVTRPGGMGRWLVSCACGMTGTAEELAWMGVRCGPCHDRREEGQPHPDDGRPALFDDGGAGCALAFYPDGERLAASSCGWKLRHYDLRRGGCFVHSPWDGDEDARRLGYQPLAVSPDGHYLAGGVAGEWDVRYWDLTGNEEDGHVAPLGEGDEVRGLAFSPDNRLFASCSNHGTLDLSTNEGLLFVKGSKSGSLPDRCSAFAFSPDSNTLALAHLGGAITFHDTHSWREGRSARIEALADEDFQFIHYVPDGRRLVLITGETRGIGVARRRRLHLYDVAARKTLRSCDVPLEMHVAAPSPDGRYLAYVVHDDQHSPGEILFFDLVDWGDAGRLEWNPEDALNDLAFSPDGQTLATISAAGVVKLWPWRLLLEG